MTKKLNIAQGRIIGVFQKRNKCYFWVCQKIVVVVVIEKGVKHLRGSQGGAHGVLGAEEDGNLAPNCQN